MATRYPIPFQIKLTASRNILYLGVMPRAIARTHAHTLAAWLVTLFGDMAGFTEVLLDTWVSRYGPEQTPEWLAALHPEWTPYEPPVKPKGAGAPGGAATERERPTPIAQVSQPPARGSGGGVAPQAPTGDGNGRITLADGTILDAASIARIADENRRAFEALKNGGGGGGAALPEPIPEAFTESAAQKEGE